ncbi:MAG: hypothetical protein ACRDE2_15430 [Chitinophagaceae bacterium]
MNNLAKLEKEVMGLPAEEREQLAILVWESLEKVSMHDDGGLEIALQRNKEIESGMITPISHTEFMKKTCYADCKLIEK